MDATTIESPAAWNAGALRDDESWIFTLDDRARHGLAEAVHKALDPDKALLDYRRQDFDLGPAWSAILAAFRETKRGRGIALVRGLPREGLSEKDFELLTWAIELHTGVARPQGKATQYISAVRDEGTQYRTAGGRGYSSNAELDFHTDSADVVALTTYNKAASGGMSIVTSSLAAHQLMAAEHPGLLDFLHEPIHFSRQQEQAPDESPSYPNPVFDEAGDMQLVNSHATVHSRTDFVDHDEPSRKRTLFRLWLATPEGERLPESWRAAYRAIEPRTVRGGIRGHHYDEPRRAFEARQAADLGMVATD